MVKWWSDQTANRQGLWMRSLSLTLPISLQWSASGIGWLGPSL